MNTQAHSLTLLKGENAQAPAPTVTDIFEFEFPDEIGGATWTGKAAQLQALTEYVAARHAIETIASTNQPTPSALDAARKKMAGDWWQRLADIPAIDASDANLKNNIRLHFKAAFEAKTHKILTGHELPQAKDGFGRNHMQRLRTATGRGDAALFLYRIRYWWRKATVIHGNKKWIAKLHRQWAEELGMELRTFRTAHDRLAGLGLIETTTAEFNGISMTHLRPTPKAEALFHYADND